MNAKISILFHIIAAMTLAEIAQAENMVSIKSPALPPGHVESISAQMGEIGSEIISAPVVERAGATPAQSVVYANIDEISLKKPGGSLMKTLTAAADLRKPIFIESDVWDIDKVEAVAGALFGAVARDDSAVLFAEWNGASWDITRNYRSIKMKMGRSAESKSKYSKFNAPTTKALGGSVTINPYLEFAQATFSADWYVWGAVQVYRPNDERFAIWRSNSYKWGLNQCILAWRGSHSTSDWLYTNLLNEISSEMWSWDPWWDNESGPRMGRGYADRLDNRSWTIFNELNNAGCDGYAVTGHSLGGGMTLATAYYWRYHAYSIFYDLEKLIAFNPSRVGNQAWTYQLIT